MGTSNRKRMLKASKEYFKPIRRLDIGKEYIKLRLGNSKLSDHTRTVFMDYIKIRCNHDDKFNNFIDHLNKLVETEKNKVANESSNNS